MATTARKNQTGSRDGSGAVGEALNNLRQRRTYLVDPKTQFTITKQFLVVLLAASALSISNYHVFQSVLGATEDLAVDAWISFGYCAIMVFISAWLLVLLCVFFSHRIAGPARKIGEALNHMANRDLCVRLRLRDNDLLQDLAESLNGANRDLRTGLHEISREVQRAKVLASGQPDLRASITRIEQTLESFQFTTASEVDARVTASRAARKAPTQPADVAIAG